MGGYAWVTLATNNSYSLGALVLAHSLKKAQTAHKMAVLITPAVSQSMREQLQTVFDLVKVVDVLDSKDEAHLALMKRPELGITFTKIHCWRLVEFEKCVFLDADTLVVRNCDELFEKEEFSAAPDVSWPDCFNSGVFVYRPSVETFNKLLQFAVENRSFDGGDQGLLNQFFSDWATQDIKKHLPFVYNLTSIAAYSYIPAFKHYGSETRIVHFIGEGKPWLQQVDAATRTVTPSSGSEHLAPLLQQWWDLFCEKVHPNLDKNLDSSYDGMSHPPVEANFLPIAITDEPQTALLPEPCTAYREKDDFRQQNLPYLPFNVEGPSGELLNVEFLVASVVPPPEETRDEQQRRKEYEMEEKNDRMQYEYKNKKEEENDRKRNENENNKEEEMKEKEEISFVENREDVGAVEPWKSDEEKKANEEEPKQQQQQVQEQEENQEEPPPKDPFDYNSFFPDETCVSNYLEQNVATYQPFDNHHHHHHHHHHDHHQDTPVVAPEIEEKSPPLPRFLTIPQDDLRQSGNVETHPQGVQEPNEPSEDPPREPDHHPPPEGASPPREPTPQKEATPPREVEEKAPLVEKVELSKSKSMSSFPWETAAPESPPRPTIWKSQPDLNVDPNRKYSMPKLKPILPKQRSFSKSVPSAMPKVTLYTELVISSDYRDPLDLPTDKIGFVETHIRKEARLRRSKSDADIRDKFGPLPYTPSPETEKPATPKRVPPCHFDSDYFDLSQCKRQMGNKPKPKEPARRKEIVHSLPALKPIVPGKDKKSTLIKKRKSKELSPGDGGKEKMAKRETKKGRERKSVVTPRNVSTGGTGDGLEEILERLREFSKSYQHFFGVEPRGKTVKNATVQAREGEGGECETSQAFESFPASVSTTSKETQTPKKSAVESVEFRQFRNYVKDQKETSQKGLLGLRDILSVPKETKDDSTDSNSQILENESSKQEEPPARNETAVDTLTESLSDECPRLEGTPTESHSEEQNQKDELKNHPEEGSPEAHQATIPHPSPREEPTKDEEKTEHRPVPGGDATQGVVPEVPEESNQEPCSFPEKPKEGSRSRTEVVGPVLQPTGSANEAPGPTEEEDEGEEPEAPFKSPGGEVTGAPTTSSPKKIHANGIRPEGNPENDEKENLEPRKPEGDAKGPPKPEEILCVPDFETPRSSRVTLPDAPAGDEIPGKSKGKFPPRHSPPDPPLNGRVNGHEPPPDDPPAVRRFVGKKIPEGRRSPPAPRRGSAPRESVEDRKTTSGIAGAIAQLNLEGGAHRSPESAATAHEEYLRRQNWETGNMDYMGRDSFENIWSKICQTIEAKEVEEKAAGSLQPPSETPGRGETKKEEEAAPTEEPVSLSAVLRECPEYLETLPGDPAAGPVEDDEIIFSKPENRQTNLTNITEEEEGGAEGSGGAGGGPVKLSDILRSGGSGGGAGTGPKVAPSKDDSPRTATAPPEGKPPSEKAECKTAAPQPEDESKPLGEEPQPVAVPPEVKPKSDTAGTQLQLSSGESQKKPEPEKKAEECKTVAIPSPPFVFPGPPLPPKEKKAEERPQVSLEPIPLPPPDTPKAQDSVAKTTRSGSLKEDGKQKKGVLSKILEMVGVGPKDKTEGESKSVFYDVGGGSQPKQEEQEMKPSENVEEVVSDAEKPEQDVGGKEETGKELPPSKSEETKKETEGQLLSQTKKEEAKPEKVEETRKSPVPKPARNSSPRESIQVAEARKSPSPKLKIPPKLPETEITTPTPPPHPDAPPRKNSALLKVDETILETPPVGEPSKEEPVRGRLSTEIEDIIGKAKSEVENLLQDRRSAEKDAGESSELINTMKLLMGEGGEEPRKSPAGGEAVEELRVTSEEERKRHKGEAVSSKLSDQILKAIPPPRRKAISEASASTSAIPKTPHQGESKSKPGKPSSIPVPPPRNRGKPTPPPPPKSKAKK